MAAPLRKCLILQAAAFDVFQLEPPTTERPYIKGLLDPCTNSMAAPNIPAEVLYDKQVRGVHFRQLVAKKRRA